MNAEMNIASYPVPESACVCVCVVGGGGGGWCAKINVM